MKNNNPIYVTYSDEKIRILVEEYITMLKKEFTLKGVCSYILYRAMEDNCTMGDGLFESDTLSPADSERESMIIAKIIKEGRLLQSEKNNYSSMAFLSVRF